MTILQVAKAHLFNLGLPMTRYTFVLPSEKQALHLSKCRLYCNTVTQGHLVGQIFCKDIHETLKYVDEFSEFKQ